MSLPSCLSDLKHTHGFPHLPIQDIGGGNGNSSPTMLVFDNDLLCLWLSLPGSFCGLWPLLLSSTSSQLSNPSPSVHMDKLSELMEEKLSLRPCVYWLLGPPSSMILGISREEMGGSASVEITGSGDGNDEGGGDSWLSLKCNSPNNSVKEEWSRVLTGLIRFHGERVWRNVGLSGNGFSKMCPRPPQAAMIASRRVLLFILLSSSSTIQEILISGDFWWKRGRRERHTGRAWRGLC